MEPVDDNIGEEDESNNKPNNKSAVLTLMKDLQEKNEPQIYSEAYQSSSKLAPMLKYNLKINNRLPEYDQNTEKMFQKILVPIHLINLLDGRIMVVFNDGKLYIKKNLFSDQLWLGPLDNSFYGSQTDGVGMRMVMFFPMNHNQERQIRLLGIGQDNTLYYKETEDLQSPWLKAETNGTNNDNLVYLFCDYHQSAEDYYPVLYGTISEIDGIINLYKLQFPDLICVLTGGDSQYLANRLKNSIFTHQNLVLKGLNNILNYTIETNN